MAKKVLIITYYWPPSGGAGVQRWLKFVKYLRGFGYEPVVYTVDNPRYAIEDTSLEAEIPEGIKVYRKSILEPNSSGLVSKKRQRISAGFVDDKPSFMARMMLYVRANYFIPDARMLWIKPSARYLRQVVQSEGIDLIVSSGPPHSMHMIAKILKEKTGIPWVADFRDPWTKIDYFDRLPLSSRALKKHQKLERSVLQQANQIIVIGQSMKEDFQEFAEKVHVITNGFDEEVDANVKGQKLSTRFTIAHIGSMNVDRNPEVLWKALSEICLENQQFSEDLLVQLIGNIASEIDQSLEVAGIHQIERIAYLPHKEVIQFQESAQVLLLAVNRVKNAKGILTGKIFEYMNAHRPILAIGPPDGDLAEILRKTNTGSIVDFDDVQGMKKQLLQFYDQYRSGQLVVNSNGIEKYHRRELTRELAAVFDRIPVAGN